MEVQPSTPLSWQPPTYGSSYKSGLRIRDSKSTLLETLESGQNRMEGTTALHLLRASDNVVPLSTSTEPWADIS